jgi:hypothetical protein
VNSEGRAGDLKFTRRKKTVRANLAGGLGNQLFQYHAALYIAKRLSARLVVNATLSQFGRTGHADWINGFHFPADKVIKTSSPRSFGYVLQLLRFRYLGIAERLTTSLGLEPLRVIGYLRSKVVGFDPKLEDITKSVTLSGYFQSHLYAKFLKEQGCLPDLQLAVRSTWHRSASVEFRTKKILSLHIRRGDYANEKESFGILAIEYYLAAIDDLETLGAQWDEIWVFSDEPAAIRKELTGLTNRTFRFVNPPPDSHAGESLDLMSRSKYIVIANSTFSWWAAYRSHADIVVRPSKWFKGMSDPQELFPETWQPKQSMWMD